MEASTALLGCSCHCERSPVLSLGSVDSLRQQRVGSNSLAGSPCGPRSPSRSLSLYSLPASHVNTSVVDSLNTSRNRPFAVKTGGKGEESILFSSTSLALLKPGYESSSGDVVVNRKSSSLNNHDRTLKDSVEDENGSAPEDPVAAAHGDCPMLVAAVEACPEQEARRPGRYHPQTMSISQSLQGAGSRGVKYVIGAAGRPASAAGRLGGPAGLIMGLAVAGVGIATALQKAVEIQPLAKLCSRCDGYGMECCDICDGAGHVSWEGKAHRTNICPCCFGSRLKKCPRCDGYRSKKESLPVLQKLKTPPSKSPPKKGVPNKSSSNKK